MVFAQIAGHLTPHQVRDNYRRRFGIESSYRQMRQLRIKTNTRNPALRFVYLALALTLRNIWVTLRFAYGFRHNLGHPRCRTSRGLLGARASGPPVRDDDPL
jgi:hypothetical protein